MSKQLRNAFGCLVCCCAILPLSATGSEPVLDCTAAGYDVLIANSGSEILQPGTSILWNVKFARRVGVFVLPDVLAPGDDAFISGAMGSDYLSSPHTCTATVEQPQSD